MSTTTPASVAARLETLLAAMTDEGLRARAAIREIDALEPDVCVKVLDVLVRRAAARAPHAAAAAAALAQALATLEDFRRTELRKAAKIEGLREVAALLARLPPLRSIHPAELRDPPGLEGVSLGHRKMLARGRSPDMLARLSRTGHPQVMKNLLENPLLTEPEVVRIAALRPARAEALAEISRSTRFATRPAVRRALVRNPYTPTEIALSLLPLLMAQELRDVSQDPAVHPSVRDEALRLMGLRSDSIGRRARQELEARDAEAPEEASSGDFLALVAELEAGTKLTPIDED